MDAFQPNEVANLFFAFIAAAIAASVYRKGSLPRFTLFYTAFACLIAAYFCTVIESVFMRGVFNFLEHLSYALAGIFFLLACLGLRRGLPPSAKGVG